MIKKILYALIVILVAIQFVRLERNQSEEASVNEIGQHYTVTAEVQTILKKACYDCHSNSTNYPWYTNVQPVGWWIQAHVNDGKKHLNFSEFGSYKEKKAKHKFEEIAESVTDGWMPLSSYTLIHNEAILTPEEAEMVADWASALE